ncbi:MAG: ABC transporter substrate-binding protein, partial [Dehalococcoidia bacterium]
MIRGAALGMGGAAAFALACGGGSNDEDSGSQASPEQQEAARQTIAGREDTTAQAVPGGMYQVLTTADATNLDPLASPSFTANAVGAWMYSRLLKYKVGLVDPATGEVEGDLAQSFEQPDPTTVIFKLHQTAVFDQRAPTNKRPVDAEDVVFSWNKFAAGSVSRKDLANSVDPTAPITSVEATDKNTVTMKLAFPYAPITSMLAYTRYLAIEPREADGGFDARNDTRGSGPWVLEDYQRSVKYTYKKNPNWFVQDRPFLDGWEIPIVPEYSSGLAQFRAKKVWSFGVRQEDIVATKNDLPELVLLQGEFNRTNWQIYFSLQPNSPF